MSWDWKKPDVTPLAEPKKDYEDLILGTTSIFVRGPCEAVFLARLWDLMLCISNSTRMARANTRTTQWVPPYSRPTDQLIHVLFEKTEAIVPPHIFPRLWAPLTDPNTGQLFSNMGLKLNHRTRSLGIRIPFTAKELEAILWNPARSRFALDTNNFIGQRAANREIGSLPGLTIEYPKDAMVQILDPQGRIHCPHGPAIVYGDGTPEFYWRGTRVPSTYIPVTDHWRRQYPEVDLIPLVRPYKPLTAQEALSVQNVETRRAACEIVGWHNILEDLQAIVIDKDPDPTIGELLQVFIPPTEWVKLSSSNFFGYVVALVVPLRSWFLILVALHWRRTPGHTGLTLRTINRRLEHNAADAIKRRHALHEEAG